MRSADIILAMRAANDPVRLDAIRKRQRDRFLVVAAGVATLACLVLACTCSG